MCEVADLDGEHGDVTTCGPRRCLLLAVGHFSCFGPEGFFTGFFLLPTSVQDSGASEV